MTQQTAEALAAENAELRSERERLINTVEHLQFQVEQFRRLIHGAKSERFVDPVLAQTEAFPGFEPTPAPPPAEIEKVEYERKKTKRGKGGWGMLPDDLPVEEVVVPVPEDQKTGGDGTPLKLIGYDVFERLAWRCGFFKIRYKREKYATPGNSLAGVVTAPHPGDLFDGKTGKERFDASFVAYSIVAKICDCLPLYRQSKALERVGVEVDRSTLCRLFGKSAFALRPLYVALITELLLRGIIHSDDSPVRLLDPGRGKCKTGRIWVALSGTGPPIAIYEFTPDRKSERPNRFFRTYSGTIIADDYVGYDALFGRPDESVQHAACWAHVRRKFHESVDSAGDDARPILALIRSLYAVEREAKEKAAGESEVDLFSIRRKLRERDSAKLVVHIFGQMERLAKAHPPQAPIAKAANYALNLREELSRFLTNPKLNIDNNPAENAIRPVALGRKNWLFAGSEEGGQNLAILLSLVETCKRNGVNPHTYLEDALKRVSTTPASRIADLLPHNWKRLREEQKAPTPQADQTVAA
ncbi:MAG: IS66 family transposase [Candidatus Brocadiia bacterium]